MPELDPDEEKIKEYVVAGIEKWLDKQFQTFGRWSFYAFASVVFVALLLLVLKGNGWHR